MIGDVFISTVVNVHVIHVVALSKNDSRDGIVFVINSLVDVATFFRCSFLYE